MRNLAITLILTIVAIVAFGQKAQEVNLVQTPGEFTQTELTLKAGEAYVFNVKNEGVDHALGFVIAPKGKTSQENHIASAYLTKAIEDGETASSKEVVLEKGEYVFFCPLNPTPQYSIKVE